MQRAKVNSSTLRSVGYNEENAILELEFVSDAVYQYFHVPVSVYLELMVASSKGSHFNEFVRDIYTCVKIKEPFNG